MTIDNKEKNLKQLCIYLLKGDQERLCDYIKLKYNVEEVPIRSSFGLDGSIFAPVASSSSPRWKQDVMDLAARHIDIEDNISNKAVLITQIDGSILAVTFGYGRSLLKEECIVRNFGLKVALSIIDPKKIRSVNTATFEDMVVTSQHQTSIHASQEEFSLDRITDIFRGVTGVPSDENLGRSVSGKDMLKVSVSMHISELKEILQAYISIYRSERYKENNFDWIDNISEVRDNILKEELDGCLIDLLSDPQKRAAVAISPSETIDWENIDGIFIDHAGKKLRTPSQAIDIEDYLSEVKTINIEKLKRHRLMVQSMDDSSFASSSMYTALVAQVDHEDQKYILCMGSWYQIQKNFYDKVASYIDSLPRDDSLLPKCTFEKEGEYNNYVASIDDNICLMDKILFMVEDAPSKIEACDLFTKSRMFIHVKFKTRSSMLSHLFAQGRVSYQSFITDDSYRTNVIGEINRQFGTQIASPDDNPQQYHVVYAIVTPKTDSRISNIVPFFSAVTLMQSAKALQAAGIVPTLCIITQE